MSEAEITKRVPVWTALSNLFLDTDLQEYDYRYVADQLQESGYNLHQLHAILREEVAPVFYTNLCTVTGEWQPWDSEFVRERILRHLRKRPSVVDRIFSRTWLRARRERYVEEKWEAVQSLLARR